MSKDLDALKQRLVDARTALGWTAQAAADAAGIPVDTLKNWETRGMEPGSLTLAKLARAYGVSLDWLLGLTHDVRDPPGCIVLDRELLERVLATTDPVELAEIIGEEIQPVAAVWTVPSRRAVVGYQKAGESGRLITRHILKHGGPLAEFWKMVGTKWTEVRTSLKRA